LSARRIIFRNRENDRSAVIHRDSAAQGGGTIGALADQGGPFVVQQRASGHFGRSGGAAIDDHLERKLGDRFRGVGLELLTRRPLSLQIGQQSFVDEEIGQLR